MRNPVTPFHSVSPIRRDVRSDPRRSTITARGVFMHHYDVARRALAALLCTALCCAAAACASVIDEREQVRSIAIRHLGCPEIDLQRNVDTEGANVRHWYAHCE